MEKKLREIYLNLYESFLMRDLTYIFSGFIVLGCIFYFFEKEILKAIDYACENIFKFLFFLIISYFTGYMIRQGFAFIKVFKIKVHVPLPYTYITLLGGIFNEYGKGSTGAIERLIYFMNMGSSLGSAFIISSLLFLLSFIIKHKISDLILFMISGIFLVICLIENRTVAKEIERDLNYYATILKTKKD